MMPTPPAFDALNAPPNALEMGGVEILRAAIVNDGLHVSIRRGFDEPEIWGLLIADVARHAARVFAAETELSEDTALERICQMFNAEMDAPTDFGTTSSIA
jgi:hypothetical protein